MRTNSFWGRWVLANAGGELAGLGTAALVAWIFIASRGVQETLLQHILFALALIATGAFEGAVVGAAQAWALRSRLPELPWWPWVRATILGALAAWALGMLPSTIMAAGAESPGQPAAEPGAAVQYGLAALLGAVAGPILAFFQWRVLRHHVAGAGGWLAANAAAWALGMPLVFLAVDAAMAGASRAIQVATTVALLTAAGAVVGAVHGLWLVWRLHPSPAGLIANAIPTRSGKSWT